MSSTASLRTIQKMKLFEEWMEGDHVLIHIDGGNPGVDVPPHLKGNPSLTLALSYQFQGETSHTDRSISAYLRFRGSYHHCIIPWEAIWGMTNPDGENRLWAEDLPAQLMAQLGTELNKRIASATPARPDDAVTDGAAIHEPVSAGLSAAADPQPEAAVCKEPACDGEGAHSRRKPPVLTRIK